MLDCLHPAAHATQPRLPEPGRRVRLGRRARPGRGRRGRVAGSTPSATRRRWSASASTSPTSPDYVADNDLGTARAARGAARRRLRRPARAGQQHGRVRRGPLPLRRARLRRPAPRAASTTSTPGASSPPARAAARRWRPSAVAEDAPIDPRNVYAATKLHQEHLCAAFAREPGVAVIAPALPQRLRAADAARHAVRRRREHLPQRAGGRRARRRCSRTAASGATSSTSTTSPAANCCALDAPPRSAGAFNVACGEPAHGRRAGRASWPTRATAPRPQVTGGFRLGDVRHVFASPDRARSRARVRMPRAEFEDGLARRFAAADLR